MRVAHANCFLPAGLQADLLLTDEVAVAEAADGGTIAPEDLVAEETAQKASVAAWRYAYSWFHAAGEDPTLVDDLSAGDLAAYETAIAVLMPAARGALSMTAYLASHGHPDTLISVAPGPAQRPSRFTRWEQLAANAAAEAARQLSENQIRVQPVVSSDPRNSLLERKYARTRDPELLISRTPGRMWRQGLLNLANLTSLARGRRRESLLVVEYNPTLAFSRAYARRIDRMRLVRWINDPGEVVGAVRCGDFVSGPPTARPPNSQAHHGCAELARIELAAEADFSVGEVSLTALVMPRMLKLVERYAAFIHQWAGGLRRDLSRWGVRAVLVPYDNSPPVRLLVRVAQSLEIPTFVLHDGYKADDIGMEGMSTDTALAWSTAVRDYYFARHPGRVLVTGNPRMDTSKPPEWRARDRAPVRVLVGSFTFSPVDLNCQRSDSERFLDEVLSGVASALPSVAAEVTVKLHPADDPAIYSSVLARHPQLRVRLLTEGDVLDVLDKADVYVTTYSTSLLEAALTMPVIYYRVNRQRLHPPFVDDDFLVPRTASTVSELAAILREGRALAGGPTGNWVERYLGPGNAVDRILKAIRSEVAQRGFSGCSR